MTASNKLLRLGTDPLIVRKDVNDKIIVSYDHCDVKDGSALIGAVGRGNSFEEACEDYLYYISGKTLVFYAGTSRRREVTVL